MTSLPFRSRWVRLAILASSVIAPLVLSGCDEEPIRTYRVARPEVRLIGAIIPSDSGTWFVKISGASEAVAENKESFDRLLRGLHFKDGTLIWDLPPGWTNDDG